MKKMSYILSLFKDAGFVFLMEYYFGFIMGYFSFSDIPYALASGSFFVALMCFYFVLSWTEKNALKHILIVSFILWLSSGTVGVSPLKISIINAALTFSAALTAFGLSKLRAKTKSP